jgi:hypothetical protein
MNNIFSEDKMIFLNKTHRSISNQASFQQKNSSAMDTNVTLVPVRSSYCQTETEKNDLQIINVDLNLSEKDIHLQEQLTDTFCRRLHQPLIFMNREICFRHNQTPSLPITPIGNTKILRDIKLVSHYSEQSCPGQQYHKVDEVQSTLDKSSPYHLPNPTEKIVSSTNSQPRKSSRKKSKHENSIPLALTTSLHSNVSLCNEDYFLSKYIHHLFADQHKRR